jgi:ribonuclease HI
MRQEDITSEKDDELFVFCDGACCGNGKKSAKAGYSVVFPFHEEHNGAWRLEGEPKTNNRAELMGIIKSFETASAIDPSALRRLIVYTDSMLVVNSLNMWMKKWERNMWKKSDGTEVLNKDLLMRIKDLQRNRKHDIRHVRAHTGRKDFWSINNDKADQLARGIVTGP